MEPYLYKIGLYVECMLHVCTYYSASAIIIGSRCLSQRLSCEEAESVFCLSYCMITFSCGHMSCTISPGGEVPLPHLPSLLPQCSHCPPSHSRESLPRSILALFLHYCFLQCIAATSLSCLVHVHCINHLYYTCICILNLKLVVIDLESQEWVG